VEIGEDEAELLRSLMPGVFTFSLAEKLTGLSRTTIRAMWQHGQVTAAYLGRSFDHPGIALADVETIRGRPVTIVDYAKARLMLDRQNKAQREGVAS